MDTLLYVSFVNSDAELNSEKKKTSLDALEMGIYCRNKFIENIEICVWICIYSWILCFLQIEDLMELQLLQNDAYL